MCRWHQLWLRRRVTSPYCLHNHRLCGWLVPILLPGHFGPPKTTKSHKRMNFIYYFLEKNTFPWHMFVRDNWIIWWITPHSPRSSHHWALVVATWHGSAASDTYKNVPIFSVILQFIEIIMSLDWKYTTERLSVSIIYVGCSLVLSSRVQRMAFLFFCSTLCRSGALSLSMNLQRIQKQYARNTWILSCWSCWAKLNWKFCTAVTRLGLWQLA